MSIKQPRHKRVIAPPSTPDSFAFRPEFFRLPKPGRWKVTDEKEKNGTPKKIWLPAEVDPFFGFNRSFYYLLEERGVLKLFRIRDEGKEKGVTLIRYRDVWNYVNAQVQAQEIAS